MTTMLDAPTDEGAPPAPATSAPLPGVSVGIAEPRRRYLRHETPWRLGPAVLCTAIVFPGLIGVGISWYGVSGEVTFTDQLPWLVAGVTCAALFGFGMAVWLIIGFREVRVGQRELFTDLAAVFPTAAPSVPLEGAQLPETFVVGANMTMVHRAGCQLIKGKDLTEVSSAQASSRGLKHCGMCLP